MAKTDKRLFSLETSGLRRKFPGNENTKPNWQCLAKARRTDEHLLLNFNSCRVFIVINAWLIYYRLSRFGHFPALWTRTEKKLNLF